MNVVYRSESDWVLWDARQREIQELVDEKSDQFNTEKLLFEVADELLVEKALECIKQSDYAGSTNCLSTRVERAKTLEEESEALGFKHFAVYYVREDSLRFLRRLPTSAYAIEFLQKYLNFWWSYARMAEEYFFFNCRSDPSKISEVNRLFRAATIEFPQEAQLYKRICLFLERHGEIEMVLVFCREACDRGLQDDTQKGFPFRLKRLLKKKTSVANDSLKRVG